ncbi:MAG: hypothetical protein V1763_01460 [Parcubacteria group bacterium]
MKILIFLKHALLKSSEQDAALADVMKKVRTWSDNGATVEFLTDANRFLELKNVDDRLISLGATEPKIHSLSDGEKLEDAVIKVKPTIFIGETVTLDPELKINSIAVPEFGLIANLPDDVEDLKELGKPKEVVEEAD